MSDISGFGASLRILASATFPGGFEITQFADDADPLDVPTMVIGNSAMGLNGDLVSWTEANPIPITLNIIAGSEDDTNLEVLFSANRAGKNKASAKDAITLYASYPDGSKTTATVGLCTEFMPTKGIASAGRFKSRPYSFTFENIVTVPAI